MILRDDIGQGELQMPDDLYSIAKRANVAFADVPGFVSCEVEQEAPPVLAYQFESAEAAMAFEMDHSLRSPFRLEIPSGRLSIVLEYR
jgi:hypothetical protein